MENKLRKYGRCMVDPRSESESNLKSIYYTRKSMLFGNFFLHSRFREKNKQKITSNHHITKYKYLRSSGLTVAISAGQKKRDKKRSRRRASASLWLRVPSLSTGLDGASASSFDEFFWRRTPKNIGSLKFVSKMCPVPPD